MPISDNGYILNETHNPLSLWFVTYNETNIPASNETTYMWFLWVQAQDLFLVPFPGESMNEVLPLFTKSLQKKKKHLGRTYV